MSIINKHIFFCFTVLDIFNSNGMDVNVKKNCIHLEVKENKKGIKLLGNDFLKENNTNKISVFDDNNTEITINSDGLVKNKFY